MEMMAHPIESRVSVLSTMEPRPSNRGLSFLARKTRIPLPSIGDHKDHFAQQLSGRTSARLSSALTNARFRNGKITSECLEEIDYEDRPPRKLRGSRYSTKNSPPSGRQRSFAMTERPRELKGKKYARHTERKRSDCSSDASEPLASPSIDHSFIVPSLETKTSNLSTARPATPNPVQVGNLDTPCSQASGDHVRKTFDFGSRVGTKNLKEDMS
ncbi:hypothetical protein AAMO2058_001547600 [Amorphochlora amoebiformis]